VSKFGEQLENFWFWLGLSLGHGLDFLLGTNRGKLPWLAICSRVCLGKLPWLAIGSRVCFQNYSLCQG
jgi:hypothetical protein